MDLTYLPFTQTMLLEEELKKPENYVAAGLFAALLAVPFCREGTGAPVQAATAASESEPDFKKERREIFGRLRDILEVSEGEGDPGVRFNPGETMNEFYIEGKLADCIQAADNTCYLKPNPLSMSGVSLSCFSNTWEEDSTALGIQFKRRPFGGITVRVHTPIGEFIEYEKAPHPSLDLEGSNQFYTDICNDVRAIFEEEPEVTCKGKCDVFENNPDFNAELADIFSEGFDLLTESGFEVKNGGFNVLTIGFEMDGTTHWRPFFPTQSYCWEASEVIPCWRYKPLFGFRHPVTIDGLLEYSLEKQEAMDEGEEL